jgi:hypothetical protein
VVRFTYLDDDYCEGWVEGYSIFLLDSRNRGQSFVWWLVSLLWYITDYTDLIFDRRPYGSILWMSPKILFLVLRWPIAIGVDIVYLLGVTALVVIVAGWP